MPRIENIYLGCVVFIYPSVQAARKGENIGGTGFLIVQQLTPRSAYGQIYAVTNKHIVEKLRSRSIVLRGNGVGGSAEIIPTNKDSWILSPDDDLAVLPIELFDSGFKSTLIADNQFLTENLVQTYDLGPGEETFMVGRFVGHDGKQRNLPLVRFGNIAMMPLEPIHSIDGDQIAFMVECRSLSGFSGSPVFTWIPAGSTRPIHNKPFEHPHGPWLLGVNCGHIMIPEIGRHFVTGKRMRIEAHSAIEVVIPAWKLQELLNCDRLVQERIAKEKEILERRQRGFRVNDGTFPVRISMSFG